MLTVQASEPKLKFPAAHIGAWYDSACLYPQHQRGKDRQILRVCWLADLAQMLALGSVRDPVSKYKVESIGTRHRKYTSGLHTYMHRQEYQHVHMCIHIHKP